MPISLYIPPKYKFMNNEKLTSVNKKAINTSNVTNTTYMFNGCDKLNVSEKDFDLTKLKVCSCNDKWYQYFPLKELIIPNIKMLNIFKYKCLSTRV